MARVKNMAPDYTTNDIMPKKKNLENFLNNK